MCTDESLVNPVTWGAFTGKEIITPTIIESVSFKAWLDEAFGIWGEWQRVYKPGSESARLLEKIRKGYWLVNIIHHGFVAKGALWEALLYGCRIFVQCLPRNTYVHDAQPPMDCVWLALARS